MFCWHPLKVTVPEMRSIGRRTGGSWEHLPIGIGGSSFLPYKVGGRWVRHVSACHTVLELPGGKRDSQRLSRVDAPALGKHDVTCTR